MSEENVEIVLDTFAAANERDFDRAMIHWADDIELVATLPLRAGTFSGSEAVGRWFGEWFATFERGYRFEIEETRDLGDVVVVIATHNARGRGSGAPVRATFANVYTLREGEITRVALYHDRAEAFEAAGLEE